MSQDWLRFNGGMKRPILIIGRKETIKLVVPDAAKVSDILIDIGYDYPVKLIEVGTQGEIEGYSIGEFATYLDGRTSKHKVLNLISLEISNSNMNDKVFSPRVVRSIDWIDLAWPIDRRSRRDYPMVQKYCLTGMAGSYTGLLSISSLFLSHFLALSVLLYTHIFHISHTFCLIPSSLPLICMHRFPY